MLQICFSKCYCVSCLAGVCIMCVFVGCAFLHCDFDVLNHGFGNMFLILWNIGIGMFLECYVKM